MAEKLLANGSVVVEPRTFRITITLPGDLKSFIETRAKQAKYANLHGDGNQSHYLRDLVIADRESLGAPRGKRKAVRRGR